MRFILPLAEHFATTLLTRIDQAAIDDAAATLYPDSSPATRNRQVYTPVSAILRHAGVAIVIQRPKGAQGTPRTAWLDPRQAFALMAASDAVGPTFGALVKLLLYTGARLGEALTLRWSDVDLDRKAVTIRQTKTEGTRTAFLPNLVVTALNPLARDGRVFFPLTKGGKLYAMLDSAARGRASPFHIDSDFISFVTHGRPGCDAMLAWIQRPWSRRAHGGRAKARLSTSTWTQPTKP